MTGDVLEYPAGDGEGSTTVPRDITMDQLLQTLHDAKVPVEEYGTGLSKTIDHLLSEISEGEARLTIDKSGNIHREVDVLWVDVVCQIPNGDVYILREDSQKFKDGRPPKKRQLDSSIGEKLKPSEALEDGVTRALIEELGIKEIEALHFIGYEERVSEHGAFPGIGNTYKMHKFVSVIPESEFRPEGYIEEQTDKTNYYAWTLLRSPTGAN